MHARFAGFRAALFLAGAFLAGHASAQGTDGKWEPLKTDKSSHTLKYSATAMLLGKPSHVSLSFYADTTKTRTETGAVGMDLTIDKTAPLTPFVFDDFEGPDSAAGGRKLVRLAIARAGKPPVVIDTAASGWSPNGPDFAFGVTEAFDQPSTAKTMLRALAAGGDTLTITITDLRNPKVKLVVIVPMTDKAADFKALTAGLK